MRARYKRQAWYLDEDILLEGYVDKRGFHPNSFSCGFDTQRYNRKAIGREIFFDLQTALDICGDSTRVVKG